MGVPITDNEHVIWLKASSKTKIPLLLTNKQNIIKTKSLLIPRNMPSFCKKETYFLELSIEVGKFIYPIYFYVDGKTLSTYSIFRHFRIKFVSKI